ncbi:Rap1a/Tai family immunity protein [Microvirga calopogonii]|uniref:Rap1a/Tai family immunity protein n=1 Tax=Microvirga calopogonii TaxID=2078013 RepID=UPI003CCADE23
MVSGDHLRMVGNHSARKWLVRSQKVPRLFEGCLDRRSRAFDPYLGAARHSMGGGWAGFVLSIAPLPHVLAVRWDYPMRASGLVRLISAAALFGSAHAEPQWDGNQLYAACQVRRDPASDCAVFIRGVVDRYHEFIATHCAPRHVPFSEIRERVVEDLDANRLSRSLPAHQLILESIGKMSKCPLQGVPDREQ